MRTRLSEKENLTTDENKAYRYSIQWAVLTMNMPYQEYVITESDYNYVISMFMKYLELHQSYGDQYLGLFEHSKYMTDYTTLNEFKSKKCVVLYEELHHWLVDNSHLITYPL